MSTSRRENHSIEKSPGLDEFQRELWPLNVQNNSLQVAVGLNKSLTFLKMSQKDSEKL